MKLSSCITLLVLGITLTSCSAYRNKDDQNVYLAPTPPLLRGLPQGDDAFSKGFREGCYHTVGQAGYGLQRFYDRPQDPELVTDVIYTQGYTEGDRFCGVYVNNNIIL